MRQYHTPIRIAKTKHKKQKTLQIPSDDKNVEQHCAWKCKNNIATWKTV